ncbi:hypothetical protein KIN20_012661 [Parelaphostrongylus tenuis]|uniref:Superoxide dismutase [Cu-Zn] n=1 Tax=Parelaphostrongylus tenuis TaxID=148309 RepID=A0AAD5QM13_PARTN|nr:hypothetical protein KIN20_012661 [Parelaphostrongylus tenuis]
MRQILLISTVFGVIQFSDARGSQPLMRARATMFAKGNLQSEIGMVDFIQKENMVKIGGVVRGLTPGFHGFHVHENGNLGNGCADAGDHYNPFNMDHGAPNDENRHVGDLGNIFASLTNITLISILDPLVSLIGPNSVVGRAVVIHSDMDDLGRGNSPMSKTTGNSGGRVACGVIRLF